MPDRLWSNLRSHRLLRRDLRPTDIDTNTGITSGPRTAGQTCSRSTAALACQPGLFCSWIDFRCYTLCDPDQFTPGCNCVQESIEGASWFGLCL